MNSQADINDNIVLTTLKIQEKFPELIKYLDETPINFNQIKDNKIKTKDLKDYLDSLNRLIKTYAIKH